MLAYFGLFGAGIFAFIQSGMFILFFYITGISISLAVSKLLSENPQRFINSLRYFLLLAAVAGFSQYIPAVENFVNNKPSVFLSPLFLLLGFFLTGNFIVYSDPEIIWVRNE